MLDLGVVLVTAGSATSAAQVLPQVLKLKRSPLTEGLSPTAVTLGVMVNIGWALYRMSQSLWISIPSPLIAGSLYLFVLVLMARSGKIPVVAVGWAVIGALVLGTVLVVAGWVVFGAVLGLLTSVQIAPSLVAVFRVSNPTGVAPGVWILGIVQGALWGQYGLLNRDLALILYGAIGIIGGVLILMRHTASQRRNSLRPITI